MWLCKRVPGDTCSLVWLAKKKPDKIQPCVTERRRRGESGKRKSGGWRSQSGVEGGGELEVCSHRSASSTWCLARVFVCVIGSFITLTWSLLMCQTTGSHHTLPCPYKGSGSCGACIHASIHPSSRHPVSQTLFCYCAGSPEEGWGSTQIHSEDYLLWQMGLSQSSGPHPVVWTVGQIRKIYASLPFFSFSADLWLMLCCDSKRSVRHLCECVRVCRAEVHVRCALNSTRLQGCCHFGYTDVVS